MPMGARRRVEDALDVRQRHVLVEQVAHGIDEDGLRLFPRQRQLEHRGWSVSSKQGGRSTSSNQSRRTVPLVPNSGLPYPFGRSSG